jgi:hypothetical protein
MTTSGKLHPHHRAHRKRRFRVRPQSLGIGFEFFDVADFRARKSPQAPAANPDPGRERFQYLAGWVNFVLWMVLAGILVLNSDVLLAVFWFLIGRHF